MLTPCSPSCRRSERLDASMKVHECVLSAFLLCSLCLQAASGANAGGGRVLLSADGRKLAYALPIESRQVTGPSRGLLRNGTLPIHGAVREG